MKRIAKASLLIFSILLLAVGCSRRAPTHIATLSLTRRPTLPSCSVLPSGERRSPRSLGSASITALISPKGQGPEVDLYRRSGYQRRASPTLLRPVPCST